MYYTYVLKSAKDGKLYIGHTSDLKRRFDEHVNGEVDSTKDRRPLMVIYHEACRDLVKSIDREKYFKTGFGRRYLQKRI